MRSQESLAELVQRAPPEIAQSITDLLIAVRRFLPGPEEETRAPAPGGVEAVVQEFRERARTWDWGLDPDAEYSADLMEVYQSTYPWTPVEE